VDVDGVQDVQCGSVPTVHHVYDFLNQHGGAVANNVAAKYPMGLLLDNHLDKSPWISHGRALGGILVLPPPDEDVMPLLPGLILRKPHGSYLWV